MLTGALIREQRGKSETQRSFGRRKDEDGDGDGNDASTSKGISKIPDSHWKLRERQRMNFP